MHKKKFGNGYNSGMKSRERHCVTSPWIAVSNQEPPKDGTEFLYREKSNNGNWIYYAFSWIACGEVWSSGYGYENTRKVLELDGEWMEIPE